MLWNWQQPEWPNFRWNADALASEEAQFLQQSGMQIGATRHFDDDTRQLILVDMLTGEALKTAEIEGEILNRDSVQSSILSHFGLTPDSRRIPPAERGISGLMIDLHRNFANPLTQDALCSWHAMITAGRTDIQDIGMYRTQGDPMQVVSGPIQKPTIHFEAPAAKLMPKEMAEFIVWFEATAPRGSAPLPPLTRAGLAHLYFVSIHPFEDGNGRISRALAAKALAQGIGQPTLLALSDAIYRKRNAYYDALEQNNKSLEVTDWLQYFARTVLEAQARSQRLIDFILEKTKFFDRLRGKINERQSRALNRMFREGPDGFRGGLSAANYIIITGAPRATATRDLNDLVEKGALTLTGSLKSTRYWLKINSITDVD